MTHKNSDIILFQYGPKEEMANWLGHLIGVFFGFFVLCKFIFLTQDIGGMLFGIGLICTYTSSTLYHLAKTPQAKWWLKKCDHASIYVLIAATYTPILLLCAEKVDHSYGKPFLIIVWVLAIIGVIFKIFSKKRYLYFSVITYLALSWIAVFMNSEFHQALPLAGSQWIMIGGLFYTSGVAFYLMKKLPFHHFIWHLFVLAGSISHYMAIKDL